MRRGMGSIVAAIAAAWTVPAATAGLTGLRVETFVGEGWLENGYAEAGLTTYRVYAEFDGVGQEGVLAVFGADGDPMHASANDGLFHNDPLIDSNGPPLDLTKFGIWSNQWDTYVTINITDGADSPLNMTPFFGQETNDLASNWETTFASWFVTRDDAVHQPVNGRVLLAQLSVAAGVEISGELGLLVADGTTLRLEFGSACPGDVDGSQRVGFEDLLALLGAWGPCEGCPEDLDGDGDVDFDDLLDLLAAWGPCFQSVPVDLTCVCCDSGDVCLVDTNGCGCVSINDVLNILVRLGLPCEGACPEDVDCSGLVDIRDLIIVLEWWGRLPVYCP